MERLERCLHQAFRSESAAGSSFLYDGDGVGDCCVCSYNPTNNNHCARYTPIKVWTLDVVDGLKEN